MMPYFKDLHLAEKRRDEKMSLNVKIFTNMFLQCVVI